MPTWFLAEQNGYRAACRNPITHRRTIKFDKRKRFWLIQDELAGEGTHEFCFRFHLAPNLIRKYVLMVSSRCAIR